MQRYVWTLGLSWTWGDGTLVTGTFVALGTRFRVPRHLRRVSGLLQGPCRATRRDRTVSLTWNRCDVEHCELRLPSSFVGHDGEGVVDGTLQVLQKVQHEPFWLSVTGRASRSVKLGTERHDPLPELVMLELTRKPRFPRRQPGCARWSEMLP